VSGSYSQANSLGLFGMLTVELARKLAAVHADAWQALHAWPVIFAGGMVAAGVMSVLLWTRRTDHRRLRPAIPAFAAVAAAFALIRIIEPPDGAAALVHPHWGAFLALAAAVTAVAAGVVALLDRPRPVTVVLDQPPALSPAAEAPSLAASTSIAPPGW
jgi:hypothetical protein